MKRYYQRAVAAIPALPDTAVREYYDTHPSEFTAPGRVRVRHIQVATRAKAKDVARLLRTESWEKVCARYSADKVTAKSGGVLGFVSTDGDQVPGIGKAPAIVAAAFTLKEGAVSEPLKSPKGWHLIRVDEKTEAGPQPFGVVKPQIRSRLEGERKDQFQESLLDSLKRAYGVKVYADSIQISMQPTLTPAELFGQAQTAASPKSRIDLFREVVTRYPEDKSAIQAAFMIGFTYAEEMRDYPAARAAFQDFLKKYPKSDLVDSAHWMLEHMENSAPPPGLTPDSLTIEQVPAPDSPPGKTTKP
jgi:hypothetical protein